MVVHPRANKYHQVRQGPSHNILSDKDGERLQFIPERIIFQIGYETGDLLPTM